MVNELFKNIKERMIKSVEHNVNEVATIRTGRASINILDPIKVDYYGSPQPLKSIAQISVPEAQTIVVQPFDPNSLELIEKAIISSDIGLNPNNDGNLIRLTIPALTEERRKELVRVVHQIIEDGRISIRNIRRDGNEQLKKMNNNHELSDDNLKRALDDIQEMTDKHIDDLNNLQKNKELEIME
tara:strand:+ start:118 stop:672 length:555 start_codon:yes stop_codon:yes gene_type:complete